MNPALPPTHSPSTPPPMHMWGPQESSGVSLVSCAVELLCDLGQDPCPLWASGEDSPEGPQL